MISKDSKLMIHLLKLMMERPAQVRLPMMVGKVRVVKKSLGVMGLNPVLRSPKILPQRRNPPS